MSTNEQIRQFQTSEFTLICTLVYLGIEVERFEKDRTNPRKIIAVFRDDKELREALDQFWQRQIKVEPIAYWEKVKEIKGRIRTANYYANN